VFLLDVLVLVVDSHISMALSQMILKCTVRPRPSLDEVLILPFETKASSGYATLLALLLRRDEVTFALSQTIVTLLKGSPPRVVEPMSWDMKESSG
jgi:hypothetical protein